MTANMGSEGGTAMNELDTERERLTAIDIPEAVGVFDTFEDLQQAFYDLRMVGIHHSDIRSGPN
jgi:hypothetical protein